MKIRISLDNLNDIDFLFKVMKLKFAEKVVFTGKIQK